MPSNGGIEMFRKITIVAAVIASGFIASVSSAEARTNVFVGVGVPYAPGYVRGCHGWNYRYCYPRPYYYRPYPRFYYAPRAIYPAPLYIEPRYTCAQARFVLRERGWRIVDTYDCSGGVYRFVGWWGNGRYLVAVNAHDGHVVWRRPY
jgi:hypothetical protein